MFFSVSSQHETEDIGLSVPIDNWGVNRSARLQPQIHDEADSGTTVATQ